MKRLGGEGRGLETTEGGKDSRSPFLENIVNPVRLRSPNSLIPYPHALLKNTGLDTLSYVVTTCDLILSHVVFASITFCASQFGVLVFSLMPEESWGC